MGKKPLGVLCGLQVCANSHMLTSPSFQVESHVTPRDGRLYLKHLGYLSMETGTRFFRNLIVSSTVYDHVAKSISGLICDEEAVSFESVQSSRYIGATKGHTYGGRNEFTDHSELFQRLAFSRGEGPNPLLHQRIDFTGQIDILLCEKPCTSLASKNASPVQGPEHL